MSKGKGISIGTYSSFENYIRGKEPLSKIYGAKLASERKLRLFTLQTI